MDGSEYQVSGTVDGTCDSMPARLPRRGESLGNGIRIQYATEAVIQ